MNEYGERAEQLREDIPDEARDRLLDLPNVIGSGIGFREVDGERTREVCLRVYVDEKVEEIPEEDRVPEEVAGYPTDVVERESRVTTYRDNTTIRPGAAGLQGNYVYQDGDTSVLGSFGTAAVRKSDGSPVITTCKHLFQETGPDEDVTGRVIYSPTDDVESSPLAEVVEDAPRDPDLDDSLDVVYAAAEGSDTFTGRPFAMGETVEIRSEPSVGERVVLDAKYGAWGGEVIAIDETVLVSDGDGNTYRHEGVFSYDGSENDVDGTLDPSGTSGGGVFGYDPEADETYAYGIQISSGGIDDMTAEPFGKVQSRLGQIEPLSDSTYPTIAESVGPACDVAAIKSEVDYVEDTITYWFLMANTGASTSDLTLTVEDSGGTQIASATWTLDPSRYQIFSGTVSRDRAGETLLADLQSPDTDSHEDQTEFTLQTDDEEILAPTIVSTTSPTEQGDTLRVRTEVENPSPTELTDDVVLSVGGSESDRQEVTVPAESTETVDLYWETDYNTATGEYPVDVSTSDASDSTTATVEEGTATSGSASVGTGEVGTGEVGTGSAVDGVLVDVFDTNSPVDEGAVLEIEVYVENTTSSEQTQDIDLVIE